MIIFSCKEVSRLASEALDRKLSWPERLAMRAHLLMCPLCRLYRRQIVALARLLRLRQWGQSPPEYGPQLSAESRARITHVLRRPGPQ